MSLRGPSPGGRAVAVAICLAVTGATPVVDGVDRVVPDSAALSLAVEARQRLRDFRDAHGLPELGEAAELDLLAYQHASELASSGRVSHYSEIHGLTTATRVRLAYPYVRTLAENVARGGTIERIHVKLLNSPGHRANRLDPRFTHVGIGVARRGEHMLYLAEVYIAVPGGGDPGPVATLYTDRPPGTFEREEAPRGEVIAESIRVGPPGDDDPEYWTSLGVEAFARGDLESAIADFRHALALDTEYDDTRFDLARALLRAGLVEEATTVFSAYLEREPSDIEAVGGLASAQLLTQDFGGAETALRRVLAQRPRDAGSWYNLGLALEYQDRPAEAAAAYAQALHIDPALQAARAGLARVSR